MVSMKRAGQFLLGVTLVASVISIHALYNPIDTLTNLIKKAGISDTITIYINVYYYVMIVSFLISANFAIVNIKMGICFQAIASLMFLLTFDNFLLYDSKADKMIKGFHILCHIVFLAALRESYKEDLKETSEISKLKDD